MNKIVLLLPAAILIAGCTTATPPEAPLDFQAQETQKIARILEKGGSAFCTITDVTDNTTTEMTISGKKVKISATNTPEGKKSHIINDTVNVYSWEEGQSTGFKMKLNTEEEVRDTAQNNTESLPDYESAQDPNMYDDETKYTLDCSEKNVPDSEFIPPSGVNFVDPSQIQNMTPQELQKLYPQGEE